MKKLGLYIVTPILSFLGGFYVFAWAMEFFTNEQLGRDAASVLFWGGTAYLILAVPLYFAIIYLIDKKLKRFKFLLYPLGCMAVFFIPVSGILGMFNSYDYLSPEAMLFTASS